MQRSTSEILNELGITDYTQKGDNYIMRCLNPSHNDTHPSMSMDIETGVFRCWGCNYKGNLVTLYKDLTGNRLDTGYSNDGYSNPNYSTKSIKSQKPKGDIELTEGRELSVFDNPKVMSYLKSIGVYDEETIYDLEIKYVKFARYKSKYTPEFDENGEYIKGTAFVNRIIFPIYGADGELVNIEGRSFDGGTPKVLYPKNAVSDTIYNLDRCDPSKPLVVNEGLKNLLKIRNVYDNVVSIFGSNFSTEKQKMLKDKGFNDIILFLDNDKASFGMADKFDETWDYDFKVCHSDIEGEDANDMNLRAIKYKINNAEDYGTWLFNRLKKEMGEFNNEERFW